MALEPTLNLRFSFRRTHTSPSRWHRLQIAASSSPAKVELDQKYEDQCIHFKCLSVGRSQHGATDSDGETYLQFVHGSTLGFRLRRISGDCLRRAASDRVASVPIAKRHDSAEGVSTTKGCIPSPDSEHEDEEQSCLDADPRGATPRRAPSPLLTCLGGDGPNVCMAGEIDEQSRSLAAMLSSSPADVTIPHAHADSRYS